MSDLMSAYEYVELFPVVTVFAFFLVLVFLFPMRILFAKLCMFPMQEPVCCVVIVLAVDCVVTIPQVRAAQLEPNSVWLPYMTD